MTGMYGEEEFIEERNCCRPQFGCLCGTSSCRCCCRFCPKISESTSTRMVYIFFLMLSIGMMALMISDPVKEGIMDLFPDENIVCKWLGAGEHCQEALGYVAVYRLGFAFACYHFLLMLITCGVSSSRQCRAGLHNGMWFYKFLLLLTFCVGAFFIPDPDNWFITVWMYTAMAGAALFIVIQLMLLVFLYHSWTDKIAARVENGGSPCFWYGFVALMSSIIVYSVCACAIILLYYYFASEEGCDQNRWFILVNTAACILVSVVAVVKQGTKDIRLRLLHSSLVSMYVIYLTWTAIGSAPRKFKKPDKSNIWIGPGTLTRILSIEQQYNCGPNGKEETQADRIMPYVTFFITFSTAMYSAIGTATAENCQAIEFPSCPTKPQIHRYKVEDIGGQKVVRNEASGLAYSYSLFHVMLGLATLYMMMSLTAWYTPEFAKLMTFGRSWSAVWIKMSSSWVCLMIYLTVTIFPTILPGKGSRTAPINGTIVNGSLRGSLRSLGDDDEAAVPLSPSKPAKIVQETTV